MQNEINIKGAKQHNLKNISFKIPRNKLVVFTGVSGSGKSSIVFNVIYSEGRRRLMESLSSYERMALQKIDEANVDLIEGLSPTIAIEQKTASRNSRSTIGTLTNIYSYVRVLYSRASYGFCTKCNKKLPILTHKQIMDNIITKMEDFIVEFVAPDVDLKENIKVGTLCISQKNVQQVQDMVGKSLELGNGLMRIKSEPQQLEKRLVDFCCDNCGLIISEIPASGFSFNNPLGSCPTCTGLGTQYSVDPKLIIPDRTKSVAQGAINIIGWKCEKDKFHKNRKIFESLANAYEFDLNTPINDLNQNALKIILYGTGEEKIVVENPSIGGKSIKERFPGIVNIVSKRIHSKDDISTLGLEDKQVMREQTCPTCSGKRLKSSRMLYRVKNKTIDEFSNMSLYEVKEFCESFSEDDCLSNKEYVIARPILRDILTTVNLMIDLGLGYLTINRSVSMMSGGEMQRARLTTQLQSKLMGLIYVLDEPSIGLHSRDNDKMVEVLQNLRDLGNTVILVEHDDEIISRADYVIEMGPGAGSLGGEITAQGTVEEIINNSNSLTGKYLGGKLRIPIPALRRKTNSYLEISGANKNNLKNVSVKIPLGCFVGVTGVSGSGKSTLVNDVIYKSIWLELHGERDDSISSVKIRGIDNITDVVHINQMPIGKTSRSNPATYVGMMDHIRKLFANTKQAKQAKFTEKRFSFNTMEGQCKACKGLGVNVIEMQFMSNIEVECEVCHGKRYREDVLEVKFKDKNIYEVLDMCIEDAAEFFKEYPNIYEKLYLLQRMGLGYIKLGQPATTLSGGESQRIKLGKELENKNGSYGKLYILDEPTIGLHLHDINKLIVILQELVDKGNTVLVIEHNLHLIKTFDYIIDLGPGGGEFGGEIVAEGTPEEIAEANDSYTGNYLRNLLNNKGMIAYEYKNGIK